MSFSYSAASVDNNYQLNESNNSNNSNNSNQPIQKKKLSNQHKTQRQRPPSYDSGKTKAVVQNIQNQTSYSREEGFASLNGSDDNNNLGDFAPLAPPISVGQERLADSNVPINNASPDGTFKSSLIETEESGNLHNLDQNFMTEQQSKEYYRNLMGNYPNTTSIKRQQQPTTSSSTDPVLTKLNYLINLMEEQQSEKTDCVIEDIVLYSFLGVFIIFVVDSFVRVGKYVR